MLPIRFIPIIASCFGALVFVAWMFMHPPASSTLFSSPAQAADHVAASHPSSVGTDQG